MLKDLFGRDFNVGVFMFVVMVVVLMVVAVVEIIMMYPKRDDYVIMLRVCIVMG